MLKFFVFLMAAAGLLLGARYAFERGFMPAATSTFPANPTYSYNNTSESMIFITSPKPGDNMTSTVIIKGFALGAWYFEGVFPVVVENDTGMEIAEGQGKANGDWTSQGFVPFTAEVDVKAPYTGNATVVLKKDNASGDPSHDASVSFPVIFQ